MSRPLTYLSSPKNEGEAEILIKDLEKNVNLILEALKLRWDDPVIETIEEFIKGDFLHLRDYIDTTPVNHKGQFTYLNGKLLKLF